VIRTLEYFKSCLIHPHFEIFSILGDPSHPQHQNLLDDLDEINEDMLSKYIQKNKYVKVLVKSSENKEQELRAYYLIDVICKEVAREKIRALKDDSPRPKPYNSENLREVEIDSNNLVDVKNFDFYNNGYQYNGFVYSLTPPVVSQINSNYWISRTIINLAKKSGLHFKIRLDPFIEKRKSKYMLMFQKMFIYGQPLNWDRLKRLRNEEHGRWLDGRENSEIGVTEYVWRPEENEIHFTCEELPKINCLDYRGSRFLHAIFDKATGNLKHLDGALRIYSQEEYKERIKFHVKDPRVRKIGKRVKIFLINDTVSKDIFVELAMQFFVWNEDVRKYFSAAL